MSSCIKSLWACCAGQHGNSVSHVCAVGHRQCVLGGGRRRRRCGRWRPCRRTASPTCWSLKVSSEIVPSCGNAMLTCRLLLDEGLSTMATAVAGSCCAAICSMAMVPTARCCSRSAKVKTHVSGGIELTAWRLQCRAVLHPSCVALLIAAISAHDMPDPRKHLSKDFELTAVLQRTWRPCSAARSPARSPNIRAAAAISIGNLVASPEVLTAVASTTKPALVCGRHPVYRAESRTPFSTYRG